ncbi:helix-turn-helix domain-containing protein [Nocardioides gansuensis]|uniref:AraC-like ligand-binding domain-containing protein n=1 Tax=Nocardioides gansuensis TaxID=2138300 RepID=UPI0014040BB5|nr:helix-turn-helix domain-containing protein [Nocardioides gansuensis]
MCDQFVPLAVNPDAVELRGRVAGWEIAETRLRRIRATRHMFERRARDIRAGDPEVLHLLLLDHGRTLVEQDGRTATLTPGDLLLYDSTRPFRFETDGDFQFTICLLPKRLLPVPESLQRNCTARVFKSEDGVAAALAPLLTALARRASDTDPSQQLALQHAMVNMYVALMADENDSGHHPSVHLSFAKSFVVRNLGNPKLSPSDVAAACNISLSYLHRLFATEGITVAGYLREQRLQAAYRDLVAPSFAEPISRVAERWGLPDPAHFNRVFKNRFGVTPGELRRAPRP